MPVTLRRHLRTVKDAAGKRVVPISAKKEGFVIGRAQMIASGARRIKSYSTEAERGILAAKAAQKSIGIRRGNVKLPKEIGWANFFVNEKKAMDILKNKYGGNEILGRNAWLKGDTMEGSLQPAKPFAEIIVKRRLGLALAAEAGKGGFGRKAIPINDVLLDNVTHSWIVESVVQRLTHGLSNAPKMVASPKEGTGLQMA
ncbi:MAG: hypothetical protein AABW59_04430, partial [archaeon]